MPVSDSIGTTVYDNYLANSNNVISSSIVEWNVSQYSRNKYNG
ncbi:MAG: hypothetical protein QW478_05325 [Candidatus Micrarchaeaceae archaeon]